MVLGPKGAPLALGFRLDAVPGVPTTDSDVARSVSASAKDGPPAGSNLDKTEWDSLLSSLANELRRTRYHRTRLGELVAAMQARRELVGGPVLGDWGAAPPAYYEAAAFLSAVRTAVDIVGYVAARRAGRSRKRADNWNAKAAIDPNHEPGAGTAPTKYDVPEILLLRAHIEWFLDLSLYRNVTHHFGWHQDSLGYFRAGDTAEEATDPLHNVIGPRCRSAPGPKASRRVDVHEPTAAGLVRALSRSRTARDRDTDRHYTLGGAHPGEGNCPGSRAADSAAELAALEWRHGGRRPANPVEFESKPAATRFAKDLRKQGFEFRGGTLRAVTPTLLGQPGLRYIFGYDEGALGDRALLKLIGRGPMDNAIVLHEQEFRPHDVNGPVHGTLLLALPTLGGRPLYIFHPARTRLGQRRAAKV